MKHDKVLPVAGSAGGCPEYTEPDSAAGAAPVSWRVSLLRQRGLTSDLGPETSSESLTKSYVQYALFPKTEKNVIIFEENFYLQNDFKFISSVLIGVNRLLLVKLTSQEWLLLNTQNKRHFLKG